MSKLFDLATLKAAREKRGLSQRQLAERASVSLATLQNIEAGRANPALHTLRQIAACVDLELVLRPKQMDAGSLVDFGLPLLAEGNKAVLYCRFHLIAAMNSSSLEIKGLPERELDALKAFLSALHDHYPSVWSQLDLRWHRILVNAEVRPKLRRLALAAMARYL